MNRINKFNIVVIVIRFLITVLIFLPIIGSGQVSPKAIKNFQKAQKELAESKSESAVQYLEKALTTDPDYKEAHLALYQIHLTYNRGEKALHHISAAAKLIGKGQPNLLYNSGKLALQIGQYQKAQTYLDQYLELSKDSITRNIARRYIHTIQYALQGMTRSVIYDPKPLGSAINTDASEYLPSVNASNLTMLFTRRFRNQEDLWVASRPHVDSSWIHTKPWSQNTVNNEGAHVISADGKTIVFTRCEGPDGYGSCDLYSSALIKGVWSKPLNMGSVINTRYWESQPSLSANGRLLYFVSDRPGGIGGFDIWWSSKSTRGWSRPRPASTTINTPFHELSPSLHPDGIHLYLRSDGWTGYGSLDLFVATKQSDGTWSIPVNLGYPINDHQDQGAMVVTLDGKYGILSDQKISLQNQLLSSDLVSFLLPENVQALPCMFLSGQVMVSGSGLPIPDARIAVYNAAGTVSIDTIYADREGEFLMVLPRDQTVQLICQADSFDFYSDRIYTSPDAAGIYKYDVHLTRVISKEDIRIGQPIVLKNVLFEFGTSIFVKGAEHELNVLQQFLSANPTLHASIEGHTDNVGSPDRNQILSVDRAKAVFDYLIGHKVAAVRLNYRGFGDTKPLVANENEALRAVNRRVEIHLSK